MAKKIDFESIKQLADSAITNLSGRDSEFVKYEKMYLLDPDSELGKPKRDGAKTLWDTHPHDSIDAIVRMYTINRWSLSIPTPSVEGEGLDRETISKRKATRAAADKAERFLKALLDRSNDVSQRDVVKMAVKQFQDVLFGEGLQAISPAVGDPYDHSLHECLETLPGDADNTLAEIITKGYKINDYVIRPAKVKVYKHE